MDTLLFVESSLPDTFVSAARPNVCVVRYDRTTDTLDSIIAKVPAGTYATVGIAHHGGEFEDTYAMCAGSPPATVSGVAETDPTLTSWGPLIAFYQQLQSSFQAKTIDLIACGLYANSGWVYVLGELEKRLGIDFRASSDATGNITNGGNWTQESDGVNIRDIYFTEGIAGFAGLLIAESSYRRNTASALATGTTRTTTPGLDRDTPVDPNSFTVLSNSQYNSLVEYIATSSSAGTATVIAGAGNGVKAVAANRFAYAVIKSDNTLFAFGDAANGGSIPPAIASVTVTHIAATVNAFAAIAGGRVVCWGNSNSGAENGYVSVVDTYLNANPGDSVVAIASIYDSIVYTGANYYGSFAALTDNGKIIMWGKMPGGSSITSGIRTFSGSPTAPTISGGVLQGGYVKMYTSPYAFLFIDGNNSICMVGASTFQDTGSTYTLPATLNGVGIGTEDYPLNGSVQAISTSGNVCMALLSNGDVYAWGLAQQVVTGDSQAGVAGALVGHNAIAIAASRYVLSSLTSSGTVMNRQITNVSPYFADGVSSGPYDGITCNYTGTVVAYVKQGANGSIFIFGRNFDGSEIVNKNISATGTIGGVVASGSNAGFIIGSTGRVTNGTANTTTGSTTVSTVISSVSSVPNGFYYNKTSGGLVLALTNTSSLTPTLYTSTPAYPAIATRGTDIIQRLGYASVYSYLAAVQSVAPPVAPTVTATNGDKTINFTLSQTDNGGADITSYTVIIYDDAAGTIEKDRIYGTSPLSITGGDEVGYPLNVTYYYKAYSTNGLGDSPLTTTFGSFVLGTVPDAPVAHSVRNLNTSFEFEVASATPANFPITSYLLTVRDSAGAIVSPYNNLPRAPVTSGGNTILNGSVTGLINGQTYTVSLVAVNTCGNSAPLTMTANPVDRPTIPTLSVTPGNNSLTFTYGPGANSATVNSYTLSAVRTDGGGTSPAPVIRITGSSYTFTGLTNGVSYTCSLTALNNGGTSDPAVVYKTPTPAPTAPTVTNVTFTTSSISFSVASADPTSTQISKFTVTTSGGTSSDVSAAGGAVTVSDLTPGTRYTISVVAVNAIGTSAPTRVIETTKATPKAPTNLSAVVGNGTVTVNWTASDLTYNGEVITYTVTADDGATTPIPISGIPGTSATFNNLTNGTPYTFTVTSVNEIGNGTPATIGATPTAGPAAPALGNITRGANSIAFDISGGAANTAVTIDSYTLTYAIGDVIIGGPTSYTTPQRITLSDLTPGTTYTITLTATNTVGASLPYSVDITTYGPPSPPQNLVATVSGQTILLSWDAPAIIGGGDDLVYTVRYADTQDSTSLSPQTGTSAVIGGLTNGVTYTVYVKASTSLGDSAEVSTPATPVTSPAAPTVAVVGGNNSVELTITPNDDGGSPITGYSYSYVVDGATTNVGPITGVIPTPITISNLSGGKTYTFSARVFTAIGSSLVGSAEPVTLLFSDPPMLSKPTITVDTGRLYIVCDGDQKGQTLASLTYTIFSEPSGTILRTRTIPPGVPSLPYTELIPSGSGAGTLPPVLGTTYSIIYSVTTSEGITVTSDESNPYVYAFPPLAPSVASLTRGNTSVTVVLTPPSNNGGSPITTYTITSSPGGVSYTGANPNATLTGLTNGTSYTFTAFATNIKGNSAPVTSAAIVPATTPSAPSLVILPQDRSLAITIVHPSSNGGLPVTAFDIIYVTGTTSRAVTVTAAAAPATSTLYTLAGLINGTTYSLTAIARNAIGAGNTSTAILRKPAVQASAPTFRTLTPGNGTATIVLNAPTALGGNVITGYTVVGTPGNITATSSTTTVAVSGLTNGTAYTFIAVANTDGIDSRASARSAAVTPRTVPSVPSITAVAGNTVITGIITPAATGGSSITGYTVQFVTGTTTRTVTTTSSSYRITGLTNGATYQVSAAAKNAAGTSAFSGTASATPTTVPGAPRVAAVAGAASAIVTITPPTANGGSAITGYQITVTGGGRTQTVSTSQTATPVTVTGLTNGVAHTVSAVAVNAVGTGARAANVTVTPSTVPNAPTITRVSKRLTIATVAFSTPTNGGSAITGYDVYVYNKTGAQTRIVSGTRSPIEVRQFGELIALGNSYTFKVAAKNRNGSSTLSDASQSVNIP
jgi:hypothetical protein